MKDKIRKISNHIAHFPICVYKYLFNSFLIFYLSLIFRNKELTLTDKGLKYFLYQYLNRNSKKEKKKNQRLNINTN